MFCAMCNVSICHLTVRYSNLKIKLFNSVELVRSQVLYFNRQIFLLQVAHKVPIRGKSEIKHAEGLKKALKF